MINWLGGDSFPVGGRESQFSDPCGCPEYPQVVTGSEGGTIRVFKNAEKFNHDEWNALVQRTGGDKPPI